MAIVIVVTVAFVIVVVIVTTPTSHVLGSNLSWGPAAQLQGRALHFMTMARFRTRGPPNPHLPKLLAAGSPGMPCICSHYGKNADRPKRDFRQPGAPQRSPPGDSCPSQLCLRIWKPSTPQTLYGPSFKLQLVSRCSFQAPDFEQP